MASFDYESYITDIPDYPEPGVVFKDITPLFADAEAMRRTVKDIADHFRDAGVTKVVGPEARGFMIGVPVALELGAGFIPARKPGKLPRETYAVSYELEYGTDTLDDPPRRHPARGSRAHRRRPDRHGRHRRGDRKLVQDVSGVLVGYACILELTFLEPRKALAAAGDQELYSLVKVQ